MKCPLCLKELKELKFGDFQISYQCSELVEFAKGTVYSHYQKHEYEIFNWTEIVYVPPYYLYMTPEKTIVFIYDPPGEFSSNFKRVFSIAVPLRIDQPEKLLQRIKLLTVMS